MFAKITKNKSLLESDVKTCQINGYTVWFNGYFFIQNRYYSKNDASEYLLKLLNINALSQEIGNCNGVFSCVLINNVSNHVTICNDRFGFGQLFYIKTNDSLCISSDFWRLKNELKKPEINYEAFTELLMLRFVLSGHTMIQTIVDVLPASIYSFDFNSGKLNTIRKEYWKFQYKPVQISKEQSVRATFDKMNQIVIKYSENILKDRPLGFNLTGGIDSRFLLSLLLKNGIQANNINTYTYGAENCEDISITRMVSEVAGTKQNDYTFEFPFVDIFNTNIIDKLIEEIGFSCSYHQAYGVSKLAHHYSKDDFLLTGTDGFAIGLMANKTLFSIDSQEALRDYLYNANSPIIDPNQYKLILRKETGSLEHAIKDKIRKCITDQGEDYISIFYEWTFRNRIRKYILSAYELLNRDTNIVFPYYDYEFMDLMLSLPAEALYNQYAYINAMYKLAYTKEFEKFKTIPIERRQVKIRNGEYLLLLKRKNFFLRAIKKIFALSEKNYTYKIYKSFRKEKQQMLSLINVSLDYKSEFLRNDMIEDLIMNNRRNEYFFNFGLPAIITVLRFEKRLRSLTNKKIENE